jgi:hypothetical protein
VPSPSATDNPRVAVYIDFDNVVISRYDQVHATGSRDVWRSDNAWRHGGPGDEDHPVTAKLDQARVDVGALLDYAASFGRVAMARAYADWSVPANATYRHQLVDRAVDLTQLFPVSGTKNGADIRLAVDAVADLMQYDDLTHVVLVAGDSDYVALAQRCKRLGRYVVGIGVSGSTGRALVAACDEFTSYDDVPGISAPPALVPTFSFGLEQDPPAPVARRTAKRTSKRAAAVVEAAAPEPVAVEPEVAEPEVAEPEVAEAAPSGRTRTRAGAKKAAAKKTAAKKTTAKKAAAEPEPAPEPDEPAEQQAATSLLVRALQIVQDRADNADDWLNGGGVKSQMQRMDAGFKEKALGFRTFTAFVESRSEVVESRVESGGQLRLRLR